jgi:hypothetical protein
MTDKPISRYEEAIAKPVARPVILLRRRIKKLTQPATAAISTRMPMMVSWVRNVVTVITNNPGGWRMCDSTMI